MKKLRLLSKNDFRIAVTTKNGVDIITLEKRFIFTILQFINISYWETIRDYRKEALNDNLYNNVPLPKRYFFSMKYAEAYIENFIEVRRTEVLRNKRDTTYLKL